MERINIASPGFEFDREDPVGYRAGMAQLGDALGAKESAERLAHTVFNK